MADNSFTPSAAVITGGASGIGLELSRRLKSGGADVMIADLEGPALNRASAEGFPVAVCDVAELDQVEALADAAFDTFGAVDLVINNAGQNGVNGKLWEVDPDAARAHFDVNFWGVWNGCRAFAPRLIAQSRPSAIYNTASENSLFCAVKHSAAYIAAKHALLGMTESFREDLPPHVHAGTIIPGWVFTPLGPEQFMKFGMDVARYADIVMPQILARRRFVVSHGYNQIRIDERMDELAESYREFALPPSQDEAHDVRSVMKKLLGE